MKTLIKQAFTVRRRLIRTGKSHLPEKWAVQQMKQVEYWIAVGDVNRVCKNHSDLIIILIPNNFIPKFKAKINDSQPAI